MSHGYCIAKAGSGFELSKGFFMIHVIFQKSPSLLERNFYQNGQSCKNPGENASTTAVLTVQRPRFAPCCRSWHRSHSGVWHIIRPIRSECRAVTRDLWAAARCYMLAPAKHDEAVC